MPTINLLTLVTDANSLRPNTKRAYTNAVKQWLDFAGTDPKKWTALNCQGFYDHLRNTGVATETANGMISGGLAFVFKRANALYGIPDPTDAVNKYKPKRDLDAPNVRRAMHAPQARALLTACAGKSLLDMRDHAATVLGFYTGLRRMSLVSVNLESAIYDDAGFVTFKAQLKGGAWYNIPIDKRAWARTVAYRQQLAKLRTGTVEPMFPSIPRPRLSASAPGGVTVIGDRITEDGIYRALKERAKAANVSGFHPHIFRHTFVTWCRVAPFSMEDYMVEVVTGHKGGNSLARTVYTDTRQLYADVTKRCYEAVSAKLFPEEKTS